MWLISVTMVSGVALSKNAKKNSNGGRRRQSRNQRNRRLPNINLAMPTYSVLFLLTSANTAPPALLWRWRKMKRGRRENVKSKMTCGGGGNPQYQTIAS